MKLYDLRCNHMRNPLGIDRSPEFSWRIESDENDVMQTSYQINVALGDVVVWSTGKVDSSEQSFVPYEGELLPQSKYTWELTVKDNKGNIATSSAEFETALLSKEEWKATWIESTFPRNEEKYFTYGIENPVVLFEKEFGLKAPVKSARLYATSYGCYRPLINGKRIDDREFAPEFTPYGKILNYQTYDVTEFLSDENKLEFLVGNGWFFCKQTEITTEEKHNAPAVLFQLDVLYEDDTHELVCSDGTETVKKTNIVFSDLFSGERIDLTKTYSEPQKVSVRDFDKKVLRAQPMPPIKAVESFPAKEIFKSPKGEMIVDFGQTIAGRARVHIDVPKGTEVMLEYTEILDKDKNYFATMSLRQCDTIVSNGEPIEHEALFTFHGFRYIRVTGMENAKPSDFVAVILSTEKENAGAFTCDDERFNRLYKNIRYSQTNNTMSVPTDCPSREKAGWLGDILVYGETSMLNEDMTPFLKSWLSGLRADQMDDGVLPLISPLTDLYRMIAKEKMQPFGDDRMTGTSGWSDAIVWVPYSMYQVTGNKQILIDCFPAMSKWCEWIEKTAHDKRGSDLPVEIDQYLWNTGFQFGEWLVPGRAYEGFEVCKETSCYTTPFFGYYTHVKMTEICKVLGKDASHYEDVASKMKNAIVEGIFKKQGLPDFVMGGYVLAFAFDLVPEELYEEYKNKFIELVEKNGRALGTGFLATPFMLDALEIIGRHDLAKDVLFNTKQPSWLFEVLHGATTIWENWMALDEDNNPINTSYDHYAFGCVDAYIFHTVCGIDGDAGYKNITIAPNKDSGFKHFKREFNCEAGLIAVERDGEKLMVTIPCNTKARIIWNGAERNVGSGTYTMEG